MPEPGALVRVLASNEYFWQRGFPVPRVQCFAGTIANHDTYDDPTSVVMSTGDPRFPIRTIAARDVLKIEIQSGEVTGRVIATNALLNDAGSWTVRSNTDTKKTYKVSRVGAVWHCECEGYRFRRRCSHIDDVKRIAPASGTILYKGRVEEPLEKVLHQIITKQ